MDGISKWLILFLLLLLSSSAFCGLQENEDTYKKTRAKELQEKGLDLLSDGFYFQALDTFNLFLEYRKKIYGEPSYYLGSAYLYIGVTYKNLGQYKPAFANFEKAKQSYFEREDHRTRNIAKLYINIGNVYRAKLDYTNALSYFEQALSIFLDLDEFEPNDVSRAYYSLAEINYLMGNYNKAMNIIHDNFNIGDSYKQLFYYQILAQIYQNFNKNQLAWQNYQEVMKLTKSVFDDSDLELASIYMDYAEFLNATSSYAESLNVLHKAYEIIKNLQPYRGEQLSRYYELRGALMRDKTIETKQIKKFKEQKATNLKEAIKFYNKSLNALSSSMNALDINTIKIEHCISFLDVLAILQQIGDTYYELALLDKENQTNSYNNSLLKALEYYNAASRLTQQARQEISSDESKIKLAELEYYTFNRTIEIAYLAYQTFNDNKYLELAFHNAEQLKSSAIFDKISDDIAQANSLIPDSLIQYQNKLNGLVSIYNQKIFEETSSTEPDSNLVKQYRNKIFTATRERNELNILLEEKYADYYDLKYSTSMLNISEVQNRMDKNDAIFEYILIEPKQVKKTDEIDSTSQLYTLLITKTRTIFHKNEIDKQLNNSLDNVFNFMSNPAYLLTTNNDTKQFCLASHQLYKELIKPYEKELRNKNLIIIPDGKLNYISFDGLLKTLPDTSRFINFSKLDYLIKDFNINYANSANILFKNKAQKQKTKNKVLAFAPEYKSEKFDISGATYTLQPLPGVQKEVDAIANTIKTTIYRKEEATEQNFRENAKDYNILHLAMHAYINDSLPAFSRLAFSPMEGETDLNKDGWLNTTDIYNLDLNAQLAVLSACNTGTGKLKKGEGILSLARGFLYAGCPSIIMSLWEVEDASGTQIMTSFYEYLKKGKSKDEALRLAKIKYLENSNSRLAHPHYWMSFKSIGDNTPIYTSYDIYFFALLIILILTFTIDQLLRIRKIRNKINS